MYHMMPAHWEENKQKAVVELGHTGRFRLPIGTRMMEGHVESTNKTPGNAGKVLQRYWSQQRMYVLRCQALQGQITVQTLRGMKNQSTADG